MSTPTENTTTPAVYAGITEEQVKAFFAEASKATGVPMGFSSIGFGFNSYETLPSGLLTKDGSFYICEGGTTVAELVANHIAKRPATDPASRAAEKRARAAALNAEADQLEAVVAIPPVIPTCPVSVA